ncbi:MAG: hypothetical protein M3Q03_12050 [Chloroflexota bacterium]|nr:hypothetical protein [Chloroflexota bacterium]
MEIVALVLFLSVIVAAVMAPSGAHAAKSPARRTEGLTLGEPALAD